MSSQFPKIPLELAAYLMNFQQNDETSLVEDGNVSENDGEVENTSNDRVESSADVQVIHQLKRKSKNPRKMITPRTDLHDCHFTSKRNNGQTHAISITRDPPSWVLRTHTISGKTAKQSSRVGEGLKGFLVSEFRKTLISKRM